MIQCKKKHYKMKQNFGHPKLGRVITNMGSNRVQ